MPSTVATRIIYLNQTNGPLPVLVVPDLGSRQRCSRVKQVKPAQLQQANMEAVQ